MSTLSQSEMRLDLMRAIAARREARTIQDTLPDVARVLEELAEREEQRAHRVLEEMQRRGETPDTDTVFLLGMRASESGALVWQARELVAAAIKNGGSRELLSALETTLSALGEAHRLAEGAEP